MDLESGSFPTVPVVPVVIHFLYLFIFVPDDQLMITEAWKCNTNIFSSCKLQQLHFDISNWYCQSIFQTHNACWHVFRYQSRTCYSMSKISSKWASVSRRPVWADIQCEQTSSVSRRPVRADPFKRAAEYHFNITGGLWACPQVGQCGKEEAGVTIWDIGEQSKVHQIVSHH